jgi:VIT1/CCC1 family predicted Fe2+/Mn2+ transporter
MSMATASMIIGFIASSYMLLISLAALPDMLEFLYPAGLTLLVVAGLSLGILAITRGMSKGDVRVSRIVQASLGSLLCFAVMVVMGITAG